jgi:tricorn protease
MDGSTLRTPGSAIITARGEDMENYGVVPDFVVDNTPPDFMQGHDRQVEKAIEVLKGEIK